MNEMTDEQIRELFGVVPHFADQTIEKYAPDLEYVWFVTSSFWSPRASLNILEVCGTMHPDYAGLTWRKFLAVGRRMDGNLRAFRENPKYYTESPIRCPNMIFHKIDGRTYVTEDGNHRTAIGKFYLYALEQPYIHNVMLTEDVVDWSFMKLYRQLKEIRPNWLLSVTRETTSRDDGPSWKRDFYDLKLRCSVRDGHKISEWFWTKEELEAALPSLVAESSRPPEKALSIFSRLFKREGKQK